MKTTDFSVFGHDFTHAGSLSYNNDYVCKICKIRIILTNGFRLNLVIGFIDDGVPGMTVYDAEYTLTCNEQQIKSLLE
jgi:hypothetical protein